MFSNRFQGRPGAPVSLVRILLLFLWIGVAPATAYGQAVLDVHVVDIEAQAPVPNVTVHLVNEDIGLDAQRTTNARGRVEWRGLTTSGRYDVFVEESDRFYAARVSDIALRSNDTRSVTLLLTPIAQVELDEVVVEGARRGIADVNRTNAEVSSSLSAAAVEEIPVEGRNFNQVLKRLPNVTPSTGFFNEAPEVTINGGNSLFTDYRIDGMDNNEQFLGGPQFDVPSGIIKDITVRTSTFSAEHGRTTNGTINVTTKSGGNEFEGEAFYLTRPGQPLDGEFTNERGEELAQRDLSGNQVKEGFSRQQGGFSLGGPIVRDQTFFHVNVEHTTDLKDNLLDAPGVRATIDGQNQFTYVTGRVDHNWSDTWRSTLRVNANRVRIDRQGGGLTGGVNFESAGNTQQRDGVHAALQNTYTGERLVYESNVQFSWFNWDFANPNNPNSPQVAIENPQGTTIGVLGNPGFVFDNVQHTGQIQQKITYQLGRHTLKAGTDLLFSKHRLTGGGNPNGNYRVRLTESQLEAFRNARVGPSLMPRELPDVLGTDPANIDVVDFSTELRPNSFGERQDLIGLYVEDQFSPTSALTLTAGLRWDYDTLSSLGGGDGDFDNIAPRFSFNYGLDERTSLRGGYGLVYDKIVYSVVSDALQFNTTSDGFKSQIRNLVDQGILPEDTDIDAVTHRGNLTASVSDVPFLEGPSPEELRANRDQIQSEELRILNPEGYDNPGTHQFSLGVQRKLRSDLLASVDLIHTRSFGLYRLRDLNAPAPFEITPEELEAAREDPNRDPSDLVRSEEEADATRPVEPVPGGAKRIVMTETKGKARYWAANFNLIKDRGDDLYSFRLNYTLSRRRNNTEDINFLAADANDFEDEWGRSVNDRTHVVNAVGTLYPFEHFRFTVASLFQSGQPINWVPDASVFGTRDLNGDGRARSAQFLGNTDRWPGASRNSGRLPWSKQVDLSLQYAIPVQGGRIVARADIFNVFNTENLTGFANNATQSNQIQVGPPGSDIEEKNAGPPRQFQFGVRYEF